MAYLASGRVPGERIFVFTDAGDEPFRLPDGVHLAPATLSALSEASVPRDGPLVFYVAAHGEPEGIHLDDGFYSLGAVLDAIDPAWPDRLAISVADACLSSSWLASRGRSDRLPPAPPVQRHDRSWLSVSVAGDTDEVGTLRGGRLTHLFGSAVVGAADFDRDGAVGDQELYAWLFRESVRQTPAFHPVVRAPKVPATLGWWHGPARVVLTHEVESRWLITTVAGGRSRILVEAVSTPDQEVILSLPAGPYTVWRLPLEAGAGATETRVEEGEWWDVLAVEDEEVALDGDQARVWSAATTRGSSASRVEAVVADYVRSEEPVSSLSRRDVLAAIHGARRWLSVGGRVSGTPLVGGASVWPGADVGVRAVLGGGRVHVGGGLGVLLGVTPPADPADFWLVEGRGLLAVAMASWRSGQLLAVSHVGMGALVAHPRSDRVPPQASVSVLWDGGMEVRWMSGGWGIAAQGLWAPRWLFVDDDSPGGVRPFVRISSWRAGVSLERSF